jgi:hypothetical protein
VKGLLPELLMIMTRVRDVPQFWERPWCACRVGDAEVTPITVEKALA